MVILDASRRNHCVPRLASWSLGAGIVATVGANLAHGLGHGPVGALVVSAWPALALVGAFELLMTLIRAERTDRCGTEPLSPGHGAPLPEQDAPAAFTTAPTQEQTVRAWYHVGRSQRAIARELNIDRRKIKRIEQAA
jgi:hypothetical protein